MRRKFLLAAVVAAALSSCSKNEIAENPVSANNAIGFSNYIGNSTKGSVAETGTVNTENSVMGVYASYETTPADDVIAPNFMKDVDVTRGASVWTYSPLKYWPTNGVIDFYAYWPKDAAYTADATKTAGPVVEFTQADVLTDMKDFLYSNSANESRTQGTTEKVVFTFEHALSRIAFSARPAEGLATAEEINSTFITVTGVTVTPTASKIAKQGNLSFEIDGTDTKGVITAVTDEFHTGDWSPALPTGGVNLYTGTAASNLAQQGVNTNFTLTNAVENTTNEYIFIIPQTLEKGAINVEVTYTVTTIDSKLTSGQFVVENNVKSVAVPAMEFAQGVAYNFPIVIGLDAIEFGDVIVTEWPNETNKTL